MPRMYTVEFIGLLLKIFIIKTAYHLCFSPFIDGLRRCLFHYDALSRIFQLVIIWYFVFYKGLSLKMNDFYQAYKTFKLIRVLLIFHVQHYTVLF